MHFIVKFFPEMIVKSPPVRKRMARRLKQNVQRVLKGVDPSLKVIQDWEKIEVIVEGEDNDVRDELIQRLSLIHISEPTRPY